MTTLRPVATIGMPYHFGERSRGTGYQMAEGPSVLLAANAIPSMLSGREIRRTWIDDADDPEGDDLDQDGFPLPPGDQMSRQLVQCRRVAEAVREAVAANAFPLVIAGNCHTSLGVIAGIDDPAIGMVWFDAHADAETTDTSSLGMFEGMPVSVIAGKSWPLYRAGLRGFHVIPDERIITVGDHAAAHDDPFVAIDGGAVGTWINPASHPGSDFDHALRSAVDVLAARVSRVHIHIDPDVIDERILRSSRHSASKGLTPEQLLAAVVTIASELEVTSITVAAYDPTIDPNSATILIPLLAEIVECVADRP